MQRQIEVAAGWPGVTRLLQFADEIEREFMLSEDESYLTRLTIEEIATNIVKYSYHPGEQGVIRVDCRYANHTLYIAIRDNGRPFDPLTIPDPEMHDDSHNRTLGGLGIYLVRSMADLIRYHYDQTDGWNELTIVKGQAIAMFHALRDVPLFSGFSDIDLQNLAAEVSEQHLPAGKALFQQGDEGHTCYIILSGELEVVAPLGNSEIQLEVRQPGQIIGEMALIDRSPRSATVRALNKARLAVFGEHQFFQLLRANPEVAIDMLRAGTSRLRKTSQHMISGLQAKNTELERAYAELQSVQSELIRLNRMEEELAVARRIQELFLPRQLPQPAGWQIAAFNRGAQAVGGDFYDCIELAGGYLGLVVADVCGKGVPAALFVALTRSLLRAASQAPWAFQGSNPQLDDVLTGAMWLTNDYIAREHGESSMFITLFYGVLNPRTGHMSYVNAGHNPPLIANPRSQELRELEGVNLPLGVLTNQTFESGGTLLEEGEVLLGFSDGITEAMNNAGDPFGDNRLMAILRKYKQADAATLVDMIVQAVDQYGAGAPQADDMTILAIRRKSAYML